VAPRTDESWQLHRRIPPGAELLQIIPEREKRASIAIIIT
jgi:hypothetical protein